MDKPSIIIRRHPYEEPYNLHLELFVSNGRFSCAGDIYVAADDLAEIGRGLSDFPQQVPDEYIFEHGSEDPTERFYRHFRLRAYTVGRRGQCAIEFRMNLNEKPPAQGIAEFSIELEAAPLNRLGSLFGRFRRLEHLEFKWTSSDDEMLLQHQI